MPGGYSYWPGGPAGREGFWGPTTSTLDWCEENYVISNYVAEFWNSSSNLIFIGLALFGIKTLNDIHATETRHYLSFWSLIVVAIGSMLFHGTMWYNAQMMDELPMIYNGCIMLYSGLQLFPSSSSATSSKKRVILSLLFTSYSAAVTGIYLSYKDPHFLAASHGILTGSLALLLPFQIANFSKRYVELSATRANGLWRLYTYTIGSYLVGFGVWSIDNNFCNVLREIRANLGTPLGFLFEFHVWWHLFAAMGGYGCITCLVYLRMLALGRKDVVLSWKWQGALPLLESTLKRD
ncbi:alkaline phytoceramidase [Rhizoclosmatium globosum]|uniref:Alkaline phytoceramidase n=1 Tax=Rhizoclosmatium globosum TaxID=329046 RepID=A0A1Y2CA80_9FUNG|nr:alkaline phytoceramidase [Rhizoclosmatium globosum]|eukprot:ORY43846.1 alkaline phytoceramidase [Rhizoclosmatium globosum]